MYYFAPCVHEECMDSFKENSLVTLVIGVNLYFGALYELNWELLNQHGGLHTISNLFQFCF